MDKEKDPKAKGGDQEELDFEGDEELDDDDIPENEDESAESDEGEEDDEEEEEDEDDSGGDGDIESRLRDLSAKVEMLSSNNQQLQNLLAAALQRQGDPDGGPARESVPVEKIEQLIEEGKTAEAVRILARQEAQAAADELRAQYGADQRVVQRAQRYAEVARAEFPDLRNPASDFYAATEAEWNRLNASDPTNPANVLLAAYRAAQKSGARPKGEKKEGNLKAALKRAKEERRRKRDPRPARESMLSGSDSQRSRDAARLGLSRKELALAEDYGITDRKELAQLAKAKEHYASRRYKTND
jgi:hypothetical protein